MRSLIFGNFSRNCTFFTTTGIVGVAALLAMPGAILAQKALPGKLIGRSGADLAAYAEAPVCAERVVVTIVGQKPDLFKGGISPAARFFGAVRAGHSLSCPKMQRMVAKGINNDKVIFSGMADRSNNWEAVILGATVLDVSAENALAAQKGPSERSVFLKSPNLVDAHAVVATAKSVRYLCHDPSPKGCGIVSEFAESAGGVVTVTNRYPLSAAGTVAVVSTTAQYRDGLLCADAQSSNVKIEDARMSPEARNDYMEQVRDRMRSSGDVCTGFSGNVRTGLTVNAFSTVGRKLGEPTAARFQPNLPNLAFAQ